MADVRPFRGVRFNPERFGRDLSDLVCPPFDVISGELQAQLYDRHPRNVVRLELTQAAVGEDPYAKYQRAAHDYAAWLADGTLIQDDRPAVYGYQCRFEVEGRLYQRRGLIAALHLEPWERGVVKPHERTLKGPIEDRMQLMRACRANFSPIWVVYRGAAEATQAFWASVSDGEPDAVVTEHGVSHALWAGTEPTALAGLYAALAELPVYIADGHHRYTTALALRDELAGGRGPDDAPNFVLAHLLPSDDPGLTSLGIHRLVRWGAEISEATLRSVLERWFELDEAPQRSAEGLLDALRSRRGAPPAFAVWAPRLGLGAVASLRASEIPSDLAPDRSDAWRKLDAVALHMLAIDQAVPGGTAGLLEAGRLTYGYTLAEVERALETEQADAAFFLRETPIEQIMAVADAGDRMPEKSTLFYPKPVTGAVMASLQGVVPPPE